MENLSLEEHIELARDYVSRHLDAMGKARLERKKQKKEILYVECCKRSVAKESVEHTKYEYCPEILPDYKQSKHTLKAEKILREQMPLTEETFGEAVLKIIDEKNLKDVDVYRAADLDKRIFSKIRSHRDYHPTKDTAVSLAFGLELNAEETNVLLKKCGYTLSHSIQRDVIIEYLLDNGVYNLTIVNEILGRFDEKPL